jgi:23S rRNA pseudouridine1911/1915/1917 synthase
MDAAELDILLEDGPLLAINKPPGIITQGAPRGVEGLVDLARSYLKRKYDKPGNVYLGIPHRLDRPVSGVVIFSRNSKCAARLAEQFAQRQVRKVYWACLERPPAEQAGTLVDWVFRIPDQPRVEIATADTPGARRAELSYRVLGTQRGRALVEVELQTGRMHQIRIQFASRGCPIVGDAQYGARTTFAGASSGEREGAIALHARSLTLQHPVRYEPVTITAPPPAVWRELGFDLP